MRAARVVVLMCVFGFGGCLPGYAQTDDVLHEIANLKDPGWGVREAAARNLGEMKDARAVPALIAALSDPDPQLGYYAAEALGTLKDARAVEPLIALAGQSKNPNAADEATLALGEFKDARAVTVLIDAMNRNKEPRKDEKLASSLGRIGGFAIPQLTAELKNPDPAVRAHALEALGWMKDPRATGALTDHLKDADAGIREAAVTGLAGHAEAAGILRFPFDVAGLLRSVAAPQAPATRDARVPGLLIEALKDSDSGVQCAAARGLGELKVAAGVEPLTAVLRGGASGGRCAARGDSLTTVHIAVAYALGEIGDSRGVDALVVALGDSDEQVRMWSARALGRIKDARATMPLVAALEDTSTSVVREASRALAEIKDPRAVGPLMETLRRASAALDARLAQATAGLAPERAASTAISMMAIDPAVGDESYALGQMGQPAVAPIAAAMKSGGTIFRQKLVEALGQISDRAAVDGFVAALNDADAGVRGAALNAVAGAKDPRAAAAWSKAWEGATLAARKEAMRRLCRNDAAWAVGPVVAAMRDTDSGFVSGCVNSDFGEGIKTPIADAVIPLLKDADNGTRGIAARTLVGLIQTHLTFGLPAPAAEARIESALEDSLKQHNNAVIVAADSYFVARGERGSEDALIDALNGAGDEWVAQYFLICGNAKLEGAGRAWLKLHHRDIDSHIFGPMWGQLRVRPAA